MKTHDKELEYNSPSPQPEEHVVTRVNSEDLPAWAQNQPAPPNAAAQTAERSQGPTAAPQLNLPETFSARDVYDNSKHGETNKKQWGG